MVTDIKTIASFIAAAIWVDNEYDETEKTVVSEIADALEFDETELFAAVDAAIEEIRGLDEDGVNDYLQKAADAVDDEENQTQSCGHSDYQTNGDQFHIDSERPQKTID